MTRKGIEAYGRKFWGSTGLLVGAKVREVGTEACIAIMGIAEEIS